MSVRRSGRDGESRDVRDYVQSEVRAELLVRGGVRLESVDTPGRTDELGREQRVVPDMCTYVDTYITGSEDPRERGRDVRLPHSRGGEQAADLI